MCICPTFIGDPARAGPNRWTTSSRNLGRGPVLRLRASADRLMPAPIGCGALRYRLILAGVIGEEFASVLARAQDGDEAAFACLWGDLNPALVRYLRVVAGKGDEDVAAETWVTVVRGLVRFRGDEMAWRGWVFTTARRRAIDEGRRCTRRRAALEAEAAQLADAVGLAGPDPAQLVLERLDAEAAWCWWPSLRRCRRRSSSCG